MSRRPLPRASEPPVKRLADEMTRIAVALLLVGAGLAGCWVVLG